MTARLPVPPSPSLSPFSLFFPFRSRLLPGMTESPRDGMLAQQGFGALFYFFSLLFPPSQSQTASEQPNDSKDNAGRGFYALGITFPPPPPSGNCQESLNRTRSDVALHLVRFPPLFFSNLRWQQRRNSGSSTTVLFLFSPLSLFPFFFFFWLRMAMSEPQFDWKSTQPRLAVSSVFPAVFLAMHHLSPAGSRPPGCSTPIAPPLPVLPPFFSFLASALRVHRTIGQRTGGKTGLERDGFFGSLPFFLFSPGRPGWGCLARRQNHAGGRATASRQSPCLPPCIPSACGLLRISGIHAITRRVQERFRRGGVSPPLFFFFFSLPLEIDTPSASRSRRHSERLKN